MNNRYILFFVLISISLLCQAQVGINTSAPKALLHIEDANPTAPAKNTGIIVPRIKAFSASNPSIDQHGMLVFLNHDLPVDYWKNSIYFWDNKKQLWDQILDVNSVDVDYNKIIAIGRNFYDAGGNLSNLVEGGGPRYVRFVVMDAPDITNTLTSAGKLKISKKGDYSLALTGGIYKTHVGVTDYKCEVLVNGVPAVVPITSLINLAVIQLRSGVFATSQFLTLNAGDELSLIVTQEAPKVGAEARINSPFTLALTLIKEL